MSTILKNFIVFEGLDGSGTTTQMQLLAETCDRNSRLCKATFEPTDKPIGRLVRSILQKQVVTTPLPSPFSMPPIGKIICSTRSTGSLPKRRRDGW